MLVQQFQLAANQEQTDIGPRHVCDEAQSGASRGPSGRFYAQACKVAAKAPFPRPGQGLGEHHLVVAGRHPADLQSLESIVLKAQGEAGIRQGLGLGDSLLLGFHQGLGPGEIGVSLERFLDQ